MARIDIKPNGIMVPCGIFGCNTPAKYNVGNASHMYDRLFLCQDCFDGMVEAFGAYKAPEEVEGEPAAIVEVFAVEIAPEIVAESEVWGEPDTTPEPAQEIEGPAPVTGYANLSRQELVALATDRLPGKVATMKSADILAALREQDDAE